jgi:hypothetical protein
MMDSADIAARMRAAEMEAVARQRFILGASCVKTPQAIELETAGYETWAKTLGRRTFKKPFAPFHHRFWQWYWPARMKLLRGEMLTADELTALLIWGRGLGKSSHVEWACIAEGALGDGITDEPGFVGYICADSGLAEGHLKSIRNRLDSTEIAHYYPGLANPRIDKHGYQTAWRQDYLATHSGWGIVPIGLKEGVRGGRLFDLRFTMFVFDDIDNRKFSADVTKKNLEIIAYEILPAGTPQTLKLFPQNLIREDGVLAQILNRETDVLSRRIVIGNEDGDPQPAFDEVELEPDEERPGSYRIRSVVPVWEGFDVNAAEVFLSDSGKAGFMAEYQHDLEGDRTEFVLQNWRDEVHTISRSEFAARYGARAIPYYWGRRWFNDWAKTNTAKHANVAGCLSVSAQNTELPGFVFLSDCLTFEAGTEADEVALRILKTISPTVLIGGRLKGWDEIVRDAHRRELRDYTASVTDMISMVRDVRSKVIPPIVRRILKAQKLNDFRGSHEQNNNALVVYRDVYGLPFQPTNPGSDGGIELLNSLMKVDRNYPHPFRPDERGEDGQFNLGYSRFFLIVEDDAIAPPPANANPKSLHDSARARYQLKRWRELPVKDTPTGEIERGPEKRNDDFGNGLMFCVHDGLPQAVSLNYGEKIRAVSPVVQTLEEKFQDEPLTESEQLQYFVALGDAKQRLGRSGAVQRFGEESNGDWR